MKEKVIDVLIEQIKTDLVKYGDVTVLAELLEMIPIQNLIQALPEEEWDKYRK